MRDMGRVSKQRAAMIAGRLGQAGMHLEPLLGMAFRRRRFFPVWLLVRRQGPGKRLHRGAAAATLPPIVILFVAGLGHRLAIVAAFDADCLLLGAQLVAFPFAGGDGFLPVFIALLVVMPHAVAVIDVVTVTVGLFRVVH